MKYMVLQSGDQASPLEMRTSLSSFFKRPSGESEYSEPLVSCSLWSMVPATKRPRASHLPSLKRLLDGSPLGEASVNNLLVSGSKVQKPKRWAITSPPSLRGARQLTKSSSCRNSFDPA